MGVSVIKTCCTVLWEQHRLGFWASLSGRLDYYEYYRDSEGLDEGHLQKGKVIKSKTINKEMVN